MVDGTDAARGEAPDRSRRSGGAKMLHDLPVISGVQTECGQRPECIRGGPFQIGCLETEAGAEIDIKTGSAGRSQENADVIQMKIEVAGEVLLNEGHANGLAAKLADVKTAARPAIG